jgi:hypothetical protein
MISTNYGRYPGDYPVTDTGSSASIESVGWVATIPSRGIYTLYIFEITAEESGRLFITYLGVVAELRILP